MKILLLAKAQQENYIRAVEACGAQAVVKYLPDEDIDYDGMIFCGGSDVHPQYYGQPVDGSVDMDEERDRTEMALMKRFLQTGKPILGICRGIQAINVFMGGTLYQHIDGHRQEQPGWERHQPLEVLPEGMLFRLIGKTQVMVNTFHHQNIKDLAPGLVADGVSSEGYIEVCHAPDHKFLMGVQFHPECYFDQPDDDHSMAIFKAFVDACKGN